MVYKAGNIPYVVFLVGFFWGAGAEAIHRVTVSMVYKIPRYWQGHPVNSTHSQATDRVTLSAVYYWQGKYQPIRSERWCSQTQHILGLHLLLTEIQQHINNCVSQLPMAHSMRAASCFSCRPTLSDWRVTGNWLYMEIWIWELEISSEGNFFSCKIIVRV